MTSYLAVQCDGYCNSRVASAVSEYRGGGCDAVSSCISVRQSFGQIVASIVRVVGEICYQRFGDNVQSPPAKLHVVASE